MVKPIRKSIISLLSAVIVLTVMITLQQQEKNLSTSFPEYFQSPPDFDVTDYEENGYSICIPGLMHEISLESYTDELKNNFELFSKSKILPCYVIRSDSIRQDSVTIKPLSYSPDGTPENEVLTGFIISSSDDNASFFIIPPNELNYQPKVLPFDVAEDSSKIGKRIYFLRNNSTQSTDTLIIKRNDVYNSIYYNSQHLLTYEQTLYPGIENINTPTEFASSVYIRFDIIALLDFDNDSITDWIGRIDSPSKTYYIFYLSTIPGKISLDVDNRWCTGSCLHELDADYKN